MRARSVLKLAGGGLVLGVVGALSLVAVASLGGFLLSNEKCGAGGCIDSAQATAAEPAPNAQPPVTAAATPADPVASKRGLVMDATFATVGTEPTVDVQTVVRANRMADVSEATERARNGEAPEPVASATGSPHITIVAAHPVKLVDSPAADAAEAEVGSKAPDTEALAYAPPVVASKLSTLKPGDVRIGDNPVNVRASASPSGARLFALAAGAPVTVKEQSNGWVHVASVDGRDGWVYSSYLDNYDAAPVPVSKAIDPPATGAAPAKPKPTAVANTDTRVVGGAGVNVRSSPSKGGGKLFALTAGATVTVKDDQHGWLKIVDSKGRSGWAYQSFFR